MPSTPFVTASLCEPAAALLAPYPHIAGCPSCRLYAVDALADHSTRLVLSATLAYHSAYHRGDPLMTASAHFAWDGEATLA